MPTFGITDLFPRTLVAHDVDVNLATSHQHFFCMMYLHLFLAVLCTFSATLALPAAPTLEPVVSGDVLPGFSSHSLSLAPTPSSSSERGPKVNDLYRDPREIAGSVQKLGRLAKVLRQTAESRQYCFSDWPELILTLTCVICSWLETRFENGGLGNLPWSRISTSRSQTDRALRRGVQTADYPSRIPIVQGSETRNWP